MSFARKLKRKNDESIKERQREVSWAKKHGSIDVKRKLINLGTMKKKYEI